MNSIEAKKLVRGADSYKRRGGINPKSKVSCPVEGCVVSVIRLNIHLKKAHGITGAALISLTSMETVQSLATVTCLPSLICSSSNSICENESSTLSLNPIEVNLVNVGPEFPVNIHMPLTDVLSSFETHMGES